LRNVQAKRAAADRTLPRRSGTLRPPPRGLGLREPLEDDLIEHARRPQPFGDGAEPIYFSLERLRLARYLQVDRDAMDLVAGEVELAQVELILSNFVE